MDVLRVASEFMPTSASTALQGIRVRVLCAAAAFQCQKQWLPTSLASATDSRSLFQSPHRESSSQPHPPAGHFPADRCQIACQCHLLQPPNAQRVRRQTVLAWRYFHLALSHTPPSPVRPVIDDPGDLPEGFHYLDRSSHRVRGTSPHRADHILVTGNDSASDPAFHHATQSSGRASVDACEWVFAVFLEAHVPSPLGYRWLHVPKAIPSPDPGVCLSPRQQLRRYVSG